MQESGGYVKLPTPEEIDKFGKRIYCCIPLLLLTIVPFVTWYSYVRKASSAPDWWIFMAGVFGWWLALVLRVPIVLAGKGVVEQSKLSNITVLISGPAEESIRVAMLFYFGWHTRFSYILALGLGWTSIELIFTVVQCLASVRLLRDVAQGDEKAIEAFQLLGAQTGRPDPLAVDPCWGVLERCSAHAIHISMSLFGALSPWSFLVTAPLHSILNWLTVSMMPKIGIMVVELLLFCTAFALMAMALAIWGH